MEVVDHVRGNILDTPLLVGRVVLARLLVDSAGGVGMLDGGKLSNMSSCTAGKMM